MTLRIAIIGFGKIARDEHMPAIAADPRFDLVAVVSRQRDMSIELPWFATPAELVATMRGQLDAVAICTPPQVRHAIASDAITAGVSVLLEKPPAATLGEVESLVNLAHDAGCGLYAAWHSQHGAAVPEAARLLAGANVSKLEISWFEDVRKWHPGQEWIWTAGGFGVFDPGINALSIATRILPMPLLVDEAVLHVPANRQAPIAAELTFVGESLGAQFDWRCSEGERWRIRVNTSDNRRIELRDGGASLFLDGREQQVDTKGEYPSIYNHFAGVVERREIEVDREPLRIVADAFLVGSREQVEPFY